jgi:enamine deaminase RidA (YjgF/YER057c/UK114 family)
MMRFEPINPPTVHRLPGFSQAVRMGDLLFVSGQVPLTPSGELAGAGDVAAQAEQIWANLRAVLEAAGSGLERVGKITILTTDLAHRPLIAQIRDRVFAPFGFVPASTFAVVAGLARPEWLVEIEAVAAVG